MTWDLQQEVARVLKRRYKITDTGNDVADCIKQLFDGNADKFNTYCESYLEDGCGVAG